jgi:hypothetical protein
MKKRLIPLASSSILAGMMILGGSTVYADTIDSPVTAYTQNSSPNGMHMMRRWNSNVKIEALASNLGLNSDEIKQELKSGKTLKQILLENGIVPNELHQAFSLNKRNLRTGKNK